MAPPPSPIRGAVVITPADGSPMVNVPFQFNPATLRRDVAQQAIGGEPGGHSEVVRLTGPPVETLTVDLEIDALDALPNQKMAQAAASTGIFPMLTALESVIYPSSAAIESVQSALAAGTMQVAPFVAPLVLLVLGANRVMPIDPQGFKVIEQQFDLNLNPVRAVVTMTARVLNSADLVSGAAGYSQYMAYQKRREQMSQNGFVPGMPPASQGG